MRLESRVPPLAAPEVIHVPHIHEAKSVGRAAQREDHRFRWPPMFLTTNSWGRMARRDPGDCQPARGLWDRDVLPCLGYNDDSGLAGEAVSGRNHHVSHTFIPVNL